MEVDTLKLCEVWVVEYLVYRSTTTAAAAAAAAAATVAARGGCVGLS